jgi:hypothetical protein
VCAFCAWSTATSAMAIDNIRTQSQAADLLYVSVLGGGRRGVNGETRLAA